MNYNMSPKLKQKLEDFLDTLETELGPLEGLEMKFDHPIVDEERQSYPDVKEFVIYYLRKEVIPVK